MAGEPALSSIVQLKYDDGATELREVVGRAPGYIDLEDNDGEVYRYYHVVADEWAYDLDDTETVEINVVDAGPCVSCTAFTMAQCYWCERWLCIPCSCKPGGGARCDCRASQRRSTVAYRTEVSRAE